MEDRSQQPTGTEHCHPHRTCLVIVGRWSIPLRKERARIFPTQPGGSEASAGGRAKPALKEKPRYENARQLLVEAKPLEAAEDFFDSSRTENQAASSRCSSWTTFHAPACAKKANLLGGNLDAAKGDFAKLAQRPANFGGPGHDQKLSEFFKKVSTFVGEEAATPRDGNATAKDYKKDTVRGADALLVLAAKDWELGEFEDALDFFAQFEFTGPESPDEWVAEYKEVAANYETQYLAATRGSRN